MPSINKSLLSERGNLGVLIICCVVPLCGCAGRKVGASVPMELAGGEHSHRCKITLVIPAVRNEEVKAAIESLDEGNWTEALSKAEKAANNSNVDREVANYVAAIACEKLNRFEKAKSYYELAGEHSPGKSRSVIYRQRRE